MLESTQPEFFCEFLCIAMMFPYWVNIDFTGQAQLMENKSKWNIKKKLVMIYRSYPIQAQKIKLGTKL